MRAHALSLAIAVMLAVTAAAAQRAADRPGLRRFLEGDDARAAGRAADRLLSTGIDFETAAPG